MSDAPQSPPPSSPPPAPAPHEPPGTRTAGLVRWVLIFLSFALAVGAWVHFVSNEDEAGQDLVPKYRCAMHPQIVSPTRGQCPICGMDLEPIPEAAKAAPASSADAGVIWACPMHPEVVGKEGDRCPKCNMKLEPRAAPAAAVIWACPMHPEVVGKEGDRCPKCSMKLEPRAAPAADATWTCPMHPEVTGKEGDKCPKCGMKLEPRAVPPEAERPEGVVPIVLTLERQQSVGVKLADVRALSVDAPLRVSASLSAPEQGVARVHVRTPGFVESISVAETGVPVRAGQELLRLYSPAALEAQNELLAAKQFGEPGARQVAAAREKLELLGVPAGVVEQALASGKPVRAFPVVAPRSGFVTMKSAVLGAYVSSEMALYEITDLTRVYVIAELFARDAASIKVGSQGVFVPQGQPDNRVTALVDLVYPQVSPDARTVKVRMLVPNEKLKLQPGQIGFVELSRSARTALVVPRDAVVDTGRQQYVFVAELDGRIAPRLVTARAGMGDEMEVEGALKAGERVVSGATFLVDSESRLQASLAEAQARGAPTACDAEIDKVKFPDKWKSCVRCEEQHKDHGAMVQECKHAIPQPWR